MLTLWGWDDKKCLLAQWGTLLTVTIVTDRLRTQLGRAEGSDLQRPKAPTAINPADYEFLKISRTKPAWINPDPTWSLVTGQRSSLSGSYYPRNNQDSPRLFSCDNYQHFAHAVFTRVLFRTDTLLQSALSFENTDLGKEVKEAGVIQGNS